MSSKGLLFAARVILKSVEIKGHMVPVMTQNSILQSLCDHHNKDTGLCCVGIRKLSKRSDCDKNTASAAILALIKQKVISRQSKGSGSKSFYILNFDAEQMGPDGDVDKAYEPVRRLGDNQPSESLGRLQHKASEPFTRSAKQKRLNGPRAKHQKRLNGHSKRLNRSDLTLLTIYKATPGKLSFEELTNIWPNVKEPLAAALEWEKLNIREQQLAISGVKKCLRDPHLKKMPNHVKYLRSRGWRAG